MNTSYIISCAITGTLSFLLGIFVYLKNRASNVNKICMFLNLSISLWHWCLFARELTNEKAVALFLVRLCYVGTILLPPFFFHFISSLLKFRKRRLLVVFYGLSVSLLVFDLTPLFIKDVGPILSFRYYGIPGPVYLFYTLYFIGIISYSHYILFKYFKESEGQTRNQIGYLSVAAIIGFLGGDQRFYLFSI